MTITLYTQKIQVTTMTRHAFHEELSLPRRDIEVERKIASK